MIQKKQKETTQLQTAIKLKFEALKVLRTAQFNQIMRRTKKKPL